MKVGNMIRFRTSTKFSFYFRLFLYLYVFTGFNLAVSSSYDDFFKAIEMDDPVTIQRLVERGFDPNTPSADLQSPLNLAIQKGAVKVSQALAASPKLAVNQPNANDETPLMLASLKQQIPLVQTLIKRGADINRPGWTPLHYAATAGNATIIRLLLEAHAYIDAESPNGTTPLMMAAHYGTPEATKLLLEEGADPLIKNEKGLTALDFAKSGPHREAEAFVAAFVKAAEAKAAR
jgi:ankyrin repeat protein